MALKIKSISEVLDMERGLRNFKVVIGARSAVFLPVKNLGVIVVDEEQETTFQQDHLPPAIMLETWH